MRWRYLRFVWATLLLLVIGNASVYAAEQIAVRDFTLYQGSSSKHLIADIRFEYRLPESLRDSLLNGITLKNTISFDLNWHSDWWWNKTESLDKIEFELKYNALSRQYHVVNKKTNENWNFSNLAVALEHIGTVKKYALPVLPDKAFEGDAAVYIEAVLQPKTLESLNIPSKLSSLFSGEGDNKLVSQGVMWPLTP